MFSTDTNDGRRVVPEESSASLPLTLATKTPLAPRLSRSHLKTRQSLRTPYRLQWHCAQCLHDYLLVLKEYRGHMVPSNTNLFYSTRNSISTVLDSILCAPLPFVV